MKRDSLGNQAEQSDFNIHISLFADLSMYRVKDRQVDSGSQRVLMTHVNFSGCQFRTHLEIPARTDVQWVLKAKLGHYTTALKAIIVSGIQEDGLFRYEASWKMTAAERYSYQVRLNEYLQTMLISSPDILAFYRRISERYVFGGFRQFDVSS
ncbi:hypothetical protein SD71_07770 [Cohnella kolymensis]|uniref:PilZ domain-containing protein n=1 Tax=Cohnella kolymensis TaxID=1590652 RepID=A0ABR5A640_9BACL|nr:hypothetical protein [Cohnella kolymensis]KIL36491.1 hypothetical protein SD71_07770 [Cohnella kolymensis]